MNMIEKRRRMRGQGGFTLIELLVVIAILAVLAGVVVFAVNGINNNSQESACKTEARTVKTAVQAFYAQETKYPNTAGATQPGADTTTTTGKKFIPGFLESAPTLVTITYGAGATNEPTYAWAGKCVGLSGLPATP